MKDTIKTRKIALLALEGYNHSHVRKVKKALMNEGAQVKIISERGDPLQSAVIIVCTEILRKF